MAELRQDEQRAIADLLHHPGYLRLLEIIAEQERHILEEAEYEGDPVKLLRQIRFWQFVTKMNRLLRAAPASIGAELDKLKEDGQLDDYPTSRNDAWARRFGARAAVADVDEEMTDPASI